MQPKLRHDSPVQRRQEVNTITDNSILIEEARMALREMRRQGCDAQEGLETIDSYVNRIRAVSISDLVNYVIENRLTDVQRQTLRDYWFEGITPSETAQKLGIAVRTVYSARAKAQQVLKDYLEPLIMYLRSLPSADVMPAVICESRDILRAKKSSHNNLDTALENIRLSFGAETALAAAALGIKEKELIKKEKNNCTPTINELEAYSKAFGTKIILEFDNGNGEIKWKRH